MDDFADLIDAFGADAISELLGLPDSHVRTLKARRSIPPEYWGLLIEEARRRRIAGITYDTLREMRKKRFRPAKPAAVSDLARAS